MVSATLSVLFLYMSDSPEIRQLDVRTLMSLSVGTGTTCRTSMLELDILTLVNLNG